MSERLTFHSQLRALRYVGSKIRLMTKLRPIFDSLEATFIVDVFGGSGSVVMGAGFNKRVFNDLDGDVVNFFRCIADPAQATELFRRLKRMPMSRSMFEAITAHYVPAGKSFAEMDPVEAAASFFYRSAYSFGGKIRNGGFAATLSDRAGCKEITRYQSVLRRMAALRRFWSGTVIEHLDFQQCIEAYGRRQGALIFCDPPYFGTERHYSRKFEKSDHERLASTLAAMPCAAVVTYYDVPEIRELYPPAIWEHHHLRSTKNIQRGTGAKGKVDELILIRRFRPKLSPLQLATAAKRQQQPAG